MEKQHTLGVQVNRRKCPCEFPLVYHQMRRMQTDVSAPVQDISELRLIPAEETRHQVLLVSAKLSVRLHPSACPSTRMSPNGAHGQTETAVQTKTVRA